MRLRPPASPVSPEKNPPPHRTPRATRFATRRQPMAIRKVGYTTWGQTTSDSGSREKGRTQSGGCPSPNLPIGIQLMSSLAVVVAAVSADGGAGVMAPSPMNAVSARVARNDPRTDSTPHYRPRGSHAPQKARSSMNCKGSYSSLHFSGLGRYRGDVLNYPR
jgi:hypothetical protein